MKKYQISLYFNIFVFGLIIVMLGIKMYYLDRISNAGKELNDLEHEITTLKLENESLKLELNDMTSLKILIEEAKLKGFTDPYVIYEKK